MATPYRDVIDEVVTALQGSAISGVSNWTFYRAEPLSHPAVGHHCAIWFDAFEMADENNTTGDREELCRFVIRYWEPAPEKPMLVVDEAADSTLEGILDGIVAVLYANEEGLGNSYQTWVVGGTKVTDRDSALRVCEVIFTCRIRRNFT